MATATLTVNVSAGDLAKLKDLPAEIENLVKTATGVLESVRGGKHPGNALSGILGNLSGLAGQAQQTPALGELLKPIQDLLAKLPPGAMGDAQEIGKAIEELLAFFGPLKDAVLSGKFEQVYQQGVSRVFDQLGKMFQPNDEVQSAFSGLEEFLTLFAALVSWGHTPPDPKAAADLLSRTLIGIPHNLLDDAAAKLETALAPLSAILPDGPDLAQWRGAGTARLAFWQGLHARIGAGAAIDWPRLETDLRAEAHLLIDIGSARDRLLSVSLGNLNRIDFGALDTVHAAIRAIPVVKPVQISSLMDEVKNHLAGILDFFQTWQPTPAELRATVRAFIDSIIDFLGASPLGQLRALLVDFQHRLLLAIESLPFRGLARQVEDKLREIAKTLDVLDPNILRKPIHEFFQKIEDKLHEFSADTVRNAITQLWQGVQDALGQVQQKLQSVLATIQGAIDGLKKIVEEAKPALEKVSQAVAQIKVGLDSFDLSQPASLVIDELHKLKDTVAGLDLSSLPGPAVSLLHSGADALRQINLTASLNPPLAKELAKIDPTPIILHAADSLGAVTGKLKLLDPASIVQTLDAPIDELLKALGNFGPDGLQKLLHEALKPVEDAIHSLDIEHLFAPLMQLFAELNAKVDAVLNPNIIFEPLEKLFQPVVDLIDKINPENLIKLFEPHVGKTADSVGGAASPPAAIAKAGGLLKDALKPAINVEDALFGFRPGDLLIPVIDVHHQIAQAFDNLADSILEPAAHALGDALHGGLQALNPGKIELRVEGSLSLFQAEFDLGAVADRLRDAENAYHDAAVAIADAASQQLAPADAAVAARVVDLLAQTDPLSLLPALSQSTGVVSATFNVSSKLDLSGMCSSYAGIRHLESVIPAFLGDAALSAASVRQAIHALDPAPVRLEINTIFDQLGQKIVGLQDALVGAIDEFLRAAQDFLMPISPGAVIQLASQLHAALKDQLLAFSPATFKDEVKLIFDVVKKPIQAFSPKILVDELNGLRDDLVKTLEGLIASLLPDPAPFNALIAQLGQFKPSSILAPITDALQPLSALIATLDVTTLLQPLLDAIARIRGEIPKVIADIEAALDDVLAAFPEGGPASASVSITASAG